MKYYSLFFEARGIQAYIFDSGKMKEMVGASELVKQLCSQLLDGVIEHMGLVEVIPQSVEDSSKLSALSSNQVFFSRRSGGVFTALFSDKEIRDRFLEVWSIMVMSKVPGLEIVNAVSEGEDIIELIKDSYDRLAYNRNNPMTVLPEATAMNILAPRTGKPAVANEPEAGGKRVWLDEASVEKRNAVSSGSSSLLTASFLPDGCNFRFPDNLEYDEEGRCEFPFKSGSRYLGLIHADGNGLGQALIRIREEFKDGAQYATMLRIFSDRLERATVAAARKATGKLIRSYADESTKYLPLRPLVLGGDDLTVLVRADYAMQYTQDYCNAFEESTREQFYELHKASAGRIPECLTACAGLAYVKNNQPFLDAFGLAESLCDAAKKVSKKIDNVHIPASVTSLVVSNSFYRSYEDYLQKELSISKDHGTLTATMGAYSLKETENRIPNIGKLRELCGILGDEGITSATVRQYATLIFGDVNISRERWRRWLELLKKSHKDRRLLDCLKDFGVEKPEESPWTPDGRTPIFDALQLMEIESIGG